MINLSNGKQNIYSQVLIFTKNDEEVDEDPMTDQTEPAEFDQEIVSKKETAEPKDSCDDIKLAEIIDIKVSKTGAATVFFDISKDLPEDLADKIEI